MKIGIFDSGLGGLVVTKAIVKQLPEYDYIYLGDTARVPYGSRSQKIVYEFTKQAITRLFKQGCRLVILACNTASAQALKKIQRDFLPKTYPDRKVLGVIIPTLEAVGPGHKRIGIIGTLGTVKSKIYPKELKKLWPKAKIFQNASPLLVPLIESDSINKTEPFLRNYLKPLLKNKIDSLVLGCTHYPILKKLIKKIVGKNVHIISQADIVPRKLENYLNRHPEITARLSKNRRRVFEVTDLNHDFKNVSKKLFGKSIAFKVVKL